MRAVGLAVLPVPGTDDTRLPALAHLAAQAGLEEVRTRTIDLRLAFDDLAAVWEAQTPIDTPVGRSIAALNPATRARLHAPLDSLLPRSTDGRVAYAARAHAFEARAREQVLTAPDSDVRFGSITDISTEGCMRLSSSRNKALAARTKLCTISRPRKSLRSSGRAAVARRTTADAGMEKISNGARLPDGTVIGRLTTYWRSRAAGREFPARRDLDPLEFPYALGRVSLIEAHRAPTGYRYRYRLVSTELTARLGFEMTGRFADEMPSAELREYVHSFYGRAIAARAPLLETGNLQADGLVWVHSSLALPLSSDGDVIDGLMVYRETRLPVPVDRFRIPRLDAE